MSNPHQRTEAWFKDREGKLTGSAFGQAAGLGPGSRAQLWRRMMGMEPAFEGNAATEWGTDKEPVAVAAYEQHCGMSAQLVGFLTHREHDWLGCSPDFLVGEAGMGEIKCPFSQTLYDDIPAYYMAQVQGAMEVADKAYCDFVCWTPERMRVWRVARSEDYWRWLHMQLAEFWLYVQAAVEPPKLARRPKPPEVITLSKRDIELAAVPEPV